MSKTILAVCLLVAGPAAAQGASVVLKNAWARATAGKTEIGAVYLTLESPISDRLTGLSTPVASIAQLHTTTMEGGILKMARLAALDLPGAQPIKLAPGAMHIMLIGLTDKLRPGQSFPLTLLFERAGKQEVTVSIAPVGATGPEKATDSSLPMPASR